jgi:hypothetical protein
MQIRPAINASVSYNTLLYFNYPLLYKVVGIGTWLNDRFRIDLNCEEYSSTKKLESDYYRFGKIVNLTLGQSFRFFGENKLVSPMINMTIGYPIHSTLKNQYAGRFEMIVTNDINRAAFKVTKINANSKFNLLVDIQKGPINANLGVGISVFNMDLMVFNNNGFWASEQNNSESNSYTNIKHFSFNAVVGVSYTFLRKNK